MTDILSTTMLELGFNELEITLYKKFLEKSRINILETSLELNLDRSTIYKAIKKLEGENLITKINRQEYAVESPSKLASMLSFKEIKTKNLLTSLNQQLPELNTQFQKNHKKITTKVYQGSQQFINLMNEVLAQSPKEILYYGNARNQVYFVSVDFQKEWTLMRANKNIKTKMLCFKDISIDWFTSRNEEQKRELKYLPDNHKCEGFYWIYNNIVIQWNPILPKAVLTEDKVFADTLRSTFGTLWEFL